MKKINFKSKKLWIIIVLVILGAWFISSLFQNKTVSNFETVTAERGNLIQTVDVTGTVDSANNLSLNFETMGTVSNIKVEVGDEVSQGDWLTNLSLTELNASVTQAQSSLNQKIAGATQEQINVSEKQINSARVALTQAESSLEDIINISENTIGSKYVYALNILEDTYIKMYNAYAVVESIKSEYFTNNDQNGLTVRSNQEYQIKVPRDEIKSLIDIAKESKSQEDIDNAISETIPALSKILNGLTVIRNICDDVSYQSVISSTEKGLLDSQKTAISGAQISASSLENEISLLKIQNSNSINTAQSTVNTAKANLELQYANYESLVAEPRDIDISYYEALLTQATAARNKAIIFAPIDGVITKVNKNKGESISMGEVMIEMLSPYYEVNVDVPETDVVKINVGDLAEITLNALGNDTKFEGVVLSVDPSSTNIQDVVYYKVKVGIKDDRDDLFKPGMSADVTIETDTRTDVVFLPSRTILTDSETDEKYVRVLVNGEIEKRVVTVGLKADDSEVEILSGINENEEVVLRTID